MWGGTHAGAHRCIRRAYLTREPLIHIEGSDAAGARVTASTRRFPSPRFALLIWPTMTDRSITTSHTAGARGKDKTATYNSPFGMQLWFVEFSPVNSSSRDALSIFPLAPWKIEIAEYNSGFPQFWTQPVPGRSATMPLTSPECADPFLENHPDLKSFHSSIFTQI